MPELPEVETVRRIMERVLMGHRINDAEIADDELVFQSPPAAVREVLTGATVESVGRKGKYWWLDLQGRPSLLGHLGMAGWIRELGAPTVRLREHGSKPMDDDAGRPRFLKMMLTADSSSRIAFTDGRRLARVKIVENPLEDKAVSKLGPDVYNEPRSSAEIARILAKRKAPIKALLLDQGLFCGIGNYLADEILFQSRIAPARTGDSLKPKEIESMRVKMASVLETAVQVGADYEKFPDDWLFHARWGGKKGTGEIQGHELVREQIGGRTTAWSPTLQK